MAHKIFDARLRNAQQEEEALATQIDNCRKQLRTGLLQDNQQQVREMQQQIYQLTQEMELAKEKVSAIESTRSEAEQEEQEARNQLEAALNQVRTLTNSIPPLYKKLLEEIEALVTRGEELMAEYQTLRDRHFEAAYLAELIGKKVKLPNLYQINSEQLYVLAQRIRMLSQLPGSPNTAIKWQERFTQLRREQNREAKRQRREAEKAKGLYPAGRAMAS